MESSYRIANLSDETIMEGFALACNLWLSHEDSEEQDYLRLWRAKVNSPAGRAFAPLGKELESVDDAERALRTLCCQYEATKERNHEAIT
jgi:hypothetical protein